MADSAGAIKSFASSAKAVQAEAISPRPHDRLFDLEGVQLQCHGEIRRLHDHP